MWRAANSRGCAWRGSTSAIRTGSPMFGQMTRGRCHDDGVLSDEGFSFADVSARGSDRQWPARGGRWWVKPQRALTDVPYPVVVRNAAG